VKALVENPDFVELDDLDLPEGFPWRAGDGRISLRSLHQLYPGSKPNVH
jgi:hypothetical protein